jgi:hypothetical protein
VRTRLSLRAGSLQLPAAGAAGQQRGSRQPVAASTTGGRVTVQPYSVGPSAVGTASWHELDGRTMHGIKVENCHSSVSSKSFKNWCSSDRGSNALLSAGSET